MNFRLRLLGVVLAAAAAAAAASPARMPQFLSAGHGRSIRHLPCVSRRTGEQGICMFAYTCLKSNGTHLGTCIDRFYFGSCCKLDAGNDLLAENHFPVIANNQVATTDKPIVDLAQHLATETYFLTPSTEKYFVPVQTTEPNKTSTTQTYLLSTFQVVQGGGTTAKTTTTPTTTTTTTPPPPKRNSTVTYLTIRPPTTNKKPPKPAKPYTKRPSTTAKPTLPPKKPTKKPTTSKPLVRPSNATTSKPTTATSAKPTSTRPIPVSSTKPASTTAKPIPATSSKTTTTTTTTTTVKPATASTKPTVATASESAFTKPGPGYGITTFRPDLSSSSSSSYSSSSGLTTFSYVSETTVKPAVTSAWAGSTGGGSQPYGPPLKPSSTSAPAGSTVPFFPQTQWVEMVQTSTTPATTTTTTRTTTTTKTTTTAAASVSPEISTMMAIFEGLNQSDYTQVCGRRMYPQARVVGGEKSTFGKWPWQISLRQWRTSTYLHKCGAALLNENWAITAAHCVENVPPSDLLLRLGEHDLSTEDEPFGFQERRVQIVASHPQFDPRTFEYDLALLRFYEPVKFQPNIIPVCVPEDNTNFVGQTAYVTGWGRLYEDGPLPSILQEVSVPVINNTLCENMYRSAGYIEHIPEIFICAGWKKGGFDSCEGDSGGPMVIQRADKRWLLAGVISWGIGCAEPNQPGVYTRISEFREWIHQILQF